MASDGTSAPNRLNDIADTLEACEREKVCGRSLPQTLVPLLAEAECLGAFSGRQCAAVRLALARWRNRGTERWDEVVGQKDENDPSIITYQAIVSALFPDLADIYDAESEIEMPRAGAVDSADAGAVERVTLRHKAGKCELHLWMNWAAAAPRIAEKLRLVAEGPTGKEEEDEGAEGSPDFTNAAHAKEWIESQVRPRLESLHSCYGKWIGSAITNTAVERPLVTDLSPRVTTHQLSLIRQHIVVVRDWALRNGLPDVPPAPSEFKDREEAQTMFSEWCAYLDRLANGANGSSAAQARQGDGSGGGGDRETRLLTFLQELTVYENGVRNAGRLRFFPLEAGHPLHDAVESLGALPSPEPLGTWLKLRNRSRRCKTVKGWENRQRDILLKDIPALRVWGEGEVKKCRRNRTETDKTEQHDIDFDRRYMVRAVEEARKSLSEDDRVHPKVGVVVVKDGNELATAFRGELSKGEHAEFTALERKLANETVAGATVYTTLEPCTTRNHPKLPCVERLIERKVRQVVIGTLDPNKDIQGEGVQRLRDANIAVVFFPHDLMSQIEEMNREFSRHHRKAAEAAPSESGAHGATATLEDHRATPQPDETGAQFAVEGRFHVVVKGEVAIWLNGKKLEYDEQSRPELHARTREVCLHEGDLVVLEIVSSFVHRCLRMGFISKDGCVVLPLRIEHLRRVDGLPLQDINAAAIKASHTGANDARPDQKRERIWADLQLPLDDSDWLWGPDKGKTHQLAFIVQSLMFKVG